MVSLFKPPLPVVIGTFGGNGNGSMITNSASSVAVTNDGKVRVISSNTLALLIDDLQRVLVGNVATPTSSRMVVADPLGDCLTLLNSTEQVSASFSTDLNGLTIATSTGVIQLGTNNIMVHQGSLFIGGEAVTSTAAELNYLVCTPGIATALKALVVDENRSIQNIGALSADTLAGRITTSVQPDISSMGVVDFNSISLAGVPVLASSDEINYLHGISAGQVAPAKAFVFDATKSIAGINAIVANELTGTLLTAAQPNITSVGTLSALDISGRFGIGTNSPSEALEILNSAPTIRINNGTAAAEITIDSANDMHISPDNKLVIDGDVEIKGGSITGLTNVAASSMAGTMTTSSQPLITHVGTLDLLNTDGDLRVGTLTAPSASHRVRVLEQYGNAVELVRSDDINCTFELNGSGDLTIAPTRDVILPHALHISGSLTGITDLTATSISGTLLTAEQPNITRVGTLASLDVTSQINASALNSVTISGTLLTGYQPNITSVGTLAGLSVAGGISASSIEATTLKGTLITAEQPNITQIGTLVSLTVTNDISTARVNAETIVGTLLTAAQPNITQIGTLGNLTVTNLILADAIEVSDITGTLLTAAQPNITQIGTLDNLTVMNKITADTLETNNLKGTLLTAAQPNITQIGTLTSLVATSSVSTASVIATTMSGTLTTSYQPNITQVGTLTKLSVDAPLGIGQASPSAAIDIDTSSLSTEAAVRITDGTNTGAIVLSSNGLLLDCSGPSITIGSGKDIQMSGGDLIGLDSLTVNSIHGAVATPEQPNITQVGTLNYLDTGYIGLGDTHLTNYRLNVLAQNGLFETFSNGSKLLTLEMVNGDYTFNASNQRIALHTNVSLVLNGGTIIGLDTLTANSIAGTITTAAQPNITSLGALTSLNVSGPTTVAGLTSTDQLTAPSMYLSSGPLTVNGAASIQQGLSIGTTLTLGTTVVNEATLVAMMNSGTATLPDIGAAGTVVGDQLLMADASKNLSSFNNLTASNLYGAVRTVSQPYITTVGNLTNLNVSGFLGVGTTSPMRQLDVASDTGSCMRLTYAGTSAYADMSVDTSGNLTISPTGTTKMATITVGNSVNNSIPMEIGYAAFTMTSPYSYRTNAGSMGVINPVTSPTSYNYSIRATGRILCTGSIDVMSDRRLKKGIAPLDDAYCMAFVRDTTPVSYHRINGDPHQSFGYIAQDLMRAGFPELVNLVPDPDVVEEIDPDGLISPAGVAYNISYEHIIPILAKNQQRLMRENDELRAQLERILQLLDN